MGIGVMHATGQKACASSPSTGGQDRTSGWVWVSTGPTIWLDQSVGNIIRSLVAFEVIRDIQSRLLAGRGFIASY